MKSRLDGKYFKKGRVHIYLKSIWSRVDNSSYCLYILDLNYRLIFGAHSIIRRALKSFVQNGVVNYSIEIRKVRLSS